MIKRSGDPPQDGTPSAGLGARGAGFGDGGVTITQPLNMLQYGSEVEL